MNRKKWEMIKRIIKGSFFFLAVLLIVTVIFGMNFMSEHSMWFFIPFLILAVLTYVYNAPGE